jgi:hypothetical protein
VEKYVIDILNKKQNPDLYDQKLRIIKELFSLGNIDNRVFNQMRMSMNEQIEDERGLMSKTDFKKMLFTAFGRMPSETKQKVYDLIIPIV